MSTDIFITIDKHNHCPYSFSSVTYGSLGQNKKNLLAAKHCNATPSIQNYVFLTNHIETHTLQINVTLFTKAIMSQATQGLELFMTRTCQIKSHNNSFSFHTSFILGKT